MKVSIVDVHRLVEVAHQWVIGEREVQSAVDLGIRYLPAVQLQHLREELRTIQEPQFDGIAVFLRRIHDEPLRVEEETLGSALVLAIFKSELLVEGADRAEVLRFDDVAGLAHNVFRLLPKSECDSANVTDDIIISDGADHEVDGTVDMSLDAAFRTRYTEGIFLDTLGDTLFLLFRERNFFVDDGTLRPRDRADLVVVDEPVEDAVDGFPVDFERLCNLRNGVARGQNECLRPLLFSVEFRVSQFTSTPDEKGAWDSPTFVYPFCPISKRVC